MDKINNWEYKENGEIDKRILLDELATDISRKFWIEKEKAKSLIKNETFKSVENLKEEINQSNDNNLSKLDKKDVEKLFLTIKWANEVIENLSKIEIKTLKEDVEKSINIDEFKNQIEDFLPSKLLERAKDPKNLHEQILWFALWTANTLISTADILYQIWAWIIKTPYHLYMIISWKWEIKSFKNI